MPVGAGGSASSLELLPLRPSMIPRAPLQKILDTTLILSMPILIC